MQVLRQRVEIVAGIRLAGLAETAPVIDQHSMPAFNQRGDLPLPNATVERPSVNQYDSFGVAIMLMSMIFVVQIDGHASFTANVHISHAGHSRNSANYPANSARYLAHQKRAFFLDVMES